MSAERIETSLRFIGDWPWWLGVSIAFLVAGAAWLFYRRDVGTLSTWLGLLLPGLRCGAIFLLVVMFSGPVLHHRKVIGELSTLRLFVDGSQSMQLTDPSMSAARKLMILQRVGLVSAETVNMDLPHAAEAVGEAGAVAARVKSAGNLPPGDLKKLLSDLAGRIGEARERLVQTGDADRLARFGKDLYDPATALAARDLADATERSRARDEGERLGEIAKRWQEELTAVFDQVVSEIAATDSTLRLSLQKFDVMHRWERVQSMLLEGRPQPMLAQFAERYDVQVFELHGAEARSVWHPTTKASTLPRALPKPDADRTDLGSGLKSSSSDTAREQRGAIVLFSDGQHNDGDSPVEVARILGARQMPTFTVGIGSHSSPRDLAVAKVEVPDAVFYEDRLRGDIVLKDDLPVGKPFKVQISDGDKVLWEQSLLSENRSVRKVPFDFPIKDIVASRLTARKQSDVQIAGLPVELKVAALTGEGDGQPSNNEAALRFRAITQKRKVLILDGRARWETRYLRNLFERDEQWEVTAVIAGTRAGEPGFSRGDKSDQFPTEPAFLEAYDLIVFGEMPLNLWNVNELKWIANFVGQRGGAIIFIDGARGHLRAYADSPIGPLFPVELKPAGISQRITRLILPERSQALAAFSFAPDKAQNAEVWGGLQPPHWISGAVPLPGSETLLEAEVKGAYAARIPLIVERRFGAGKVLYHGFDDSWRWRFEVADEHHVHYWNQIANWIAELPFAVRDKFVSLDTGALTYRPGDSADLRVRLRDGEGRPVANAAVDAVLYREGTKYATIRLAAEENGGGLYRGRTASLEPGSYEVGVQSAAIAERDTKARTEFKVQYAQTGELILLNTNEDLLKKIAAASGGEYLREENVQRLNDLLAPLSQGKVIESDTVLWQSYWWFIPLIALLTVEWIIRKRVGLL